MKKIAKLLFITIGCVCSVTAFAAGHMKPGLWQITSKSDMMKNMPKMPPEQLEKMRQMGINIPTMQDGAMTTKMCVTKEMAERDQPPHGAQERIGCKPANVQYAGNSYSSDIVCDGPMMKGEGKVKGTFSDGVSYNSTYDFKGTSHGRPVDQHMESSGKWMGADCGDVKPMDQLIMNRKKTDQKD